MNKNPTRLFEGAIHNYFEKKRSKLLQDIQRIKWIDDIEAKAIELFSNYELELITLLDEYKKPNEYTRNVPNKWGGGTSDITVYEVQVCIPFEGDREVLLYAPPHGRLFMNNAPRLERNMICYSFQYYSEQELKDPNNFLRQSSQIKEGIELNVENLNKEIEHWNKTLLNFILENLQKKKGKNEIRDAFYSSIGIQKVSTTQKIFTRPIVKKQIPEPKTQAEVSYPKYLSLMEDIYSDIKEVIYNVGQALERKPALYQNRDEEALREIFLLFLEMRYERTTGVGEAFNKEGKTDILLKHATNGENLFIAECKFWHGKAECFKAVNQLFKYVTHRDDKTALIIFVQNKNFQNTIETIQQEISTHPDFSRARGRSFDTSLSYEFRHPESQVPIFVEVMFMHFPK